MSEASVVQRYADYINENVLNSVDYNKLQASLWHGYDLRKNCSKQLAQCYDQNLRR